MKNITLFLFFFLAVMISGAVTNYVESLIENEFVIWVVEMALFMIVILLFIQNLDTSKDNRECVEQKVSVSLPFQEARVYTKKAIYNILKKKVTNDKVFYFDIISLFDFKRRSRIRMTIHFDRLNSCTTEITVKNYLTFWDGLCKESTQIRKKEIVQQITDYLLEAN